MRRRDINEEAPIISALKIVYIVLGCTNDNVDTRIELFILRAQGYYRSTVLSHTRRSSLLAWPHVQQESALCTQRDQDAHNKKSQTK